MTAMSKVESAFCRSAPWRSFASRVVGPWALGGTEPSGRVLEVGGGSGAMAAELLSRFPNLSITVADVDPAMLTSAQRRLERFGERVDLQLADVTALSFPDGAFDQTYCWLMLHHTLRWEAALRELARVVRPGGVAVGYDLLNTPVARLIHRLDGSPHRLFGLTELRRELAGLPDAAVTCNQGGGGLVARFTIQRLEP